MLIVALSGCSAPGAGKDEPAPDAPRGDFYTTVYLDEAAALESVFPDAERVVRRDFELSREETNEVRELVGDAPRQSVYRSYIGLGADDALDGFAVIGEEIGKFKRITFIVGIEPDGEVRRVAVMTYREARGGEVARRRFLSQYDGKTLDDPLSMNRDIINVSGATMSVNAMNRGVKKALAAIEVAFRRRPDRLRRAIEDDAADRASPLPSTTGRPEAGGPVRLHRAARLLMGTTCAIEAWTDDEPAFARAAEAAFDAIAIIEAAISDWRPDSELSRLSRAAPDWVPISPVTAEFLARARELHRTSRGAFDVTVGPLVDAWGVRGETRTPTPAELAALRPLIDQGALEVRRDGGSYAARLVRPGMRLDPGGLGKGFAVDRAAEVLRAHRLDRALIDFSGTILALNAPPGTRGWPVAARDPARPHECLTTLLLANAALASSGGYEQGREVDGESRSHILSPRTLRPLTAIRGAVVIAPNATLADGWSTAATVLGREMLDLEVPAGVEAWIALDRERVATPGWPSTSGDPSSGDASPSIATSIPPPTEWLLSEKPRLGSADGLPDPEGTP